MQIANIARVEGKIIRVVGLAEGDVYKRLKTEYNDAVKLKYGVVTGIVTDGAQMVVTALEFEPSWRSVGIENVTFKGDTEVAILPATLEEYTVEYQKLLEGATKGAEEAKIKLNEAIEQIEIIKKFSPANVKFGQTEEMLETGVSVPGVGA